MEGVLRISPSSFNSLRDRQRENKGNRTDPQGGPREKEGDRRDRQRVSKRDTQKIAREVGSEKQGDRRKGQKGNKDNRRERDRKFQGGVGRKKQGGGRG